MSVRRFGEGPELVWVHGLGESSVSFEAIAARPELAAYTHVLVDLPGYGRSAWPEVPLPLAALAEHLGRWLGERAPAVVIGHSMGGVLALLVAEHGTARAIIDIEGNVTGGDCTLSGPAAAASLAEFRARGFAELKQRMYREGEASAAVRGYHAAMCFASPDAYHQHARDLVELSNAGALAARRAALRVPALYIAGVPEGICAESRAALTAAGARWIGIEPAGHWVYFDQPARFASVVARFLGELA